MSEPNSGFEHGVPKETEEPRQAASLSQSSQADKLYELQKENAFQSSDKLPSVVQQDEAAGKLISRRKFVASLGLAVGGALTMPGWLPGEVRAYAESQGAASERAPSKFGPNGRSASLHDPIPTPQWFNVKEHSAAGDGATDDAAALQALIVLAAAEPYKAALYFPAGSYRIGHAIAFPHGMQLIFDYGASLQLDAGVTVTVDSAVDAPASLLFNGGGTIVGSFHGAPVYPQWWGAKGERTHDDTESFRKVFRLAKDNEKPLTVIVPKGDYVWSELMVVYGDTSVICEEGAAFFRNHPHTMLINFEQMGEANPGYSGNGSILFENARFEFVALDPEYLCYEDGNIAQFAHASDWTFRNCQFYDVIDAHAIEVNSSKNAVIDNCQFYGYRELATNRWYVEAIQIDHASTSGIYGALPYDDTPCLNVTVRNCFFGKGRTYQFTRNGVPTTVEFKAWTCGVGGHTHKEGRWHQNIIIRNNIFEGMRYYAIRPYKWLNTLITENYFHECGGGIYAVGGSLHNEFGAAQPHRRLTISNNQFINGKAIYPDHSQANRRFAIGVFSFDGVISEDVRVEGNTISVAEDTGILIRNITRVTVSRNTINYMKRSAIEVTDCRQLLVDGNQIYQPVEQAVVLRNNQSSTIVNNHVVRSRMHGIDMQNCSLSVVTGNVITESVHSAIYGSGNQGLKIKDNMIADSREAIALADCQHVDVTGNRMDQAERNYLELNRVSGFHVSANMITAPSATTYDAISFLNQTRSGIVRDNLVTGTFRYGLWFDSTASAVRYGYNTGTIRNDSSAVEALQD
ncbi:right-handed parallel beta-helix repeat-containing protein [Paenibacillus senegalensis]|uniref:right-handed parallel beta-helix repeat-containing protein n=1 Tax=Paenibacillus senegalensis TaxID=1465766 RepID=UPI000289597C|nr:right-handed parallel beta-helix repeat-containing protein [Paenibacillus senegalensis]